MDSTDNELRARALFVAGGTLCISWSRSWSVQTSCSFRRIGTDFGDGDVLRATALGPGGQPTLWSAPGVLDYLVAAQPQRVLEILKRRDRHWRAWDGLRHRIRGHDDAFREEAEVIHLGDDASFQAAGRQVADLRALAARVDLGCGGRPWILQSSDGILRIGTSGPSGAGGDGDVLRAVTQPHDGHPDLHAAPGVLDYVALAHPLVVTRLLDQCYRVRRAIAWLQNKVEGHDEAFREAEAMWNGDLEPVRTTP